MTNPERDPDELVLDPGTTDGDVEVLPPREVPLGGPRAMRVRRTLPQRHRSLIGAWCFVDHYGPDDVADTGGMRVAPHPHTGLQTVSWLFTGEVEHTDSAGHHAMVRPGEVNLMTAGRGISHSEVSTARDHHAARRPAVGGAARRRRATSSRGSTTTRPTRSAATAGRRGSSSARCSARPPRCRPTPRCSGPSCSSRPAPPSTSTSTAEFEHGVLVDTGVVTVAGTEAKQGDLAYVCPGRTTLALVAGAEPVRLLLLGGPPFGESIVMWWNFVGRDHDEIVGFREEWQRQITRDGAVVDDSRAVADGRFGVVDHPLPPIPAPEMPHVRLRERR